MAKVCPTRFGEMDSNIQLLTKTIPHRLLQNFSTLKFYCTQQRGSHSSSLPSSRPSCYTVAKPRRTQICTAFWSKGKMWILSPIPDQAKRSTKSCPLRRLLLGSRFPNGNSFFSKSASTFRHKFINYIIIMG